MPREKKARTNSKAATAAMLCEKVRQLMHYLTDNSQYQLKRNWRKTWMIAQLHHEGYATPTQRACARLLDLLEAIDQAHKDETKPAKEQPPKPMKKRK
jgi:hypothetical protein